MNMLKKVQFNFDILPPKKNTEKKYKAWLYGGSFDLFLKMINLIGLDSTLIHHKKIKDFSFSPLIIDYTKNICYFELNVWNEEYIKIVDKIKNYLAIYDYNQEYELYRNKLVIKFSSFLENQANCFTLSKIQLEKTLDKIENNIEKVTIDFVTPFFVKKDGFYYSFPEKEIILGTLSKSYEKVFKSNPNDNETELNPVNFKIQLSKVTFNGINMHGCVGFVTYNMDKLSKEQKRILLTKLICASYTGLGAKTVHGFGNVVVYFNSYNLRDIIKSGDEKNSE